MANEANLRAGNLSDGLTVRNSKGKFDTPRAEMGRARALAILENEDYQESLLRRMIAGEAGPVEVWVWRIGYGDPPRPRDDDTDDRERFERRREAMQRFMREHPQEAALLARLVAKGERPPAELVALVPAEVKAKPPESPDDAA